ncbi:MAG TPA: response regulator [Kofleriaceae bacterium]|nr:response regulator [Kofleriaceae bacterium]
MSKIVLCVDDSVTMQQVADITFRGTEFTYVGARSYEEAVEKAKSQKPAVVLADSVMQGKNGYDVCLAIKSDAKTADVPVVILVGNGAPYDNAKGVQVGADANLPKPWDTQTMLEKVTEIVGKAASGVAKPGQGASVAPSPSAAPVAAAAAAAAAKAPAAQPGAQPPRSATIMGMPTIKMPAGNAPAATPATPGTPAVSKTTVMAVPPISPEAGRAPAAPAMRAPAAPAAAASASPAVAAAPAPAPAFNPSLGANRPPMVSGTLTKRSALVERTLAKMAARLAEATGLEPGSPELLALLKLSAEVVEKVVWEVVPDLAEQIIRENIQDLTARRGSS